MTHTYEVSGMTCTGCQAKIKGLLSQVKGVKNVDIDLSKGEAVIQMEQHIPTSEFQSALKQYPKTLKAIGTIIVKLLKAFL